MSDASSPLDGVTVGLYLAPAGSEEIEFTEPKEAVADAGAAVEVLGIETGEARTVNNDLEESDTYEVETAFDDADPTTYDALIVPGGTVGADKLRSDEDAVAFLRDHLTNGKPAGVICHGPWTLVEADVVEGRRLTSYPSLRTDIRNAGGEWVDEEVVVDDGLVTSRGPDDIEAFCDAIVDAFGE